MEAGHLNGSKASGTGDDSAVPGESTPPSLDFCVLLQKVDLNVDFVEKSLEGRTEITLQPLSDKLRIIRLDCRYCEILRVSVAGIRASYTFDDPFSKLRIPETLTIHQHHFVRQQCRPSSSSRYQGSNAAHPVLAIEIPPSLSILPIGDTTNTLDVPLNTESSNQPLVVSIEYKVVDCREGLHFVGMDSSDRRYPHVYTENSLFPGTASCLFPCIDDLNTRCPWVLSVRCPRTLADVFTPPRRPFFKRNTISLNLKREKVILPPEQPTDKECWRLAKSGLEGLLEEEKTMDMEVVCSGDMTDDIVDPSDPTRHTVSFKCDTPVSPRHIGFAIGPFEHIDLSVYRPSDQDDRLGDSAIHVHGFALPRRSQEVKNTCLTLPMCVDYFTQKYGTYPFQSYKVCFVDDLDTATSSTASLSFCSSQLLFPPDIVDTMDDTTLSLVQAVAAQWIGIKVTPKNLEDYWITIGGAQWMAMAFMATIWGRNEYRFRQKVMADRVYELDIGRPPIYDLGRFLSRDQSELDFLTQKAQLVLFILNNRIIKAMGRNGVERIFWRILSNAATGYETDAAISSQAFLKFCEKVGHLKLETFFAQWVFSSGCPKFSVSQRFNKKKLVVELIFKQESRQRERKHVLADSFFHTLRESRHGLPAHDGASLFTGPMTIRIHEADGTPYEHIVDINEVLTKVEIPYNTKYKRLKRSKQQKERAAAAAGLDLSTDAPDDVLLYSLGDTLQSEEEVREWKLVDWTKDDEVKMSEESYEWVRVDKDFEWICHVSFGQPHYMFVSQLQQDPDVVAQVDSLKYLSVQQPFPLISSILARTLMDPRYFYGIRALAARALANCAKPEIEWIGLFHLEKAFQTLYCLPDTHMPRPNDFSHRPSYLLQKAIPEALSSIKDSDGHSPARIRQFFVDKLRYNDNTDNAVSDSYYISTLLLGLTSALIVSRKPDQLPLPMADDEQAERADCLRILLSEVERYRRMDEWMSSFHNIYTVTAMECFKELALHGVISKRGTEFLQYTRPSNSDRVRVKAFQCLMELDLLMAPPVLSHFLQSFAHERSRNTRRLLWGIFENGLGKVVLNEVGKRKTIVEDSTAIPAVGSLVESDSESFPDTFAKNTNVLRSVLGKNEILKTNLLEVLRSTHLTLAEYVAVLDVCDILFEPEDKLLVTLKLPRYWKCQNLGNGKVVFTKTGAFRTQPLPKALPDQAPKPAPPSDTPTIRLLPLPSADTHQVSAVSSKQSISLPKTSTSKAVSLNLSSIPRPESNSSHLPLSSSVPVSSRITIPKLTLTSGSSKVSKHSAGQVSSSHVSRPSISPHAPLQTVESPTPSAHRNESDSQIKQEHKPIPPALSPATASSSAKSFNLPDGSAGSSTFKGVKATKLVSSSSANCKGPAKNVSRPSGTSTPVQDPFPPTNLTPSTKLSRSSAPKLSLSSTKTISRPGLVVLKFKRNPSVLTRFAFGTGRDLPRSSKDSGLSSPISSKSVLNKKFVKRPSSPVLGFRSRASEASNQAGPSSSLSKIPPSLKPGISPASKPLSRPLLSSSGHPNLSLKLSTKSDFKSRPGISSSRSGPASPSTSSISSKKSSSIKSWEGRDADPTVNALHSGTSSTPRSPVTSLKNASNSGSSSKSSTILSVHPSRNLAAPRESGSKRKSSEPPSPNSRPRKIVKLKIKL